MKTSFAVGILFLAIILLIYVPFLFIWALNVLFHLNIPSGLESWAAAAIIIVFFGTSRISVRNTNN